MKVARKNQEWYQKHLSDLGQDLEERSESDEWLQNELDRYEERMKIHHERQQEQARRYEDVKREIVQIRKRQSDKRVEAGKHEQRKATHEQKIRDREADIKRSAREHSIRGYDTELDEMQISEYLDRITKLSKDQNAKVERLRRENMLEIQKVQSVVDNLRERRSALQEGKKSGKEQITATDRKIASLHSELNTITMDEGGKAALESNIADLEDKLMKAKHEVSSGAWDARIQETNSELRTLEDRSAALNRELIQGTKQAGNLARLDHLKKELKDRQRRLETMTGAHGDRLCAIVGPEWQPTTLEADYQRVLDSKKRLVTDAERQRDGVSRELEQVEFKLQTARTDVKKKERELEACTQVLREITQGDPDEYPELLMQLKVDRDIRKEDVNGYESMKKYFTDCIEVAKSDQPACRMCSRTFADEKSIRQFVKKLESKVSQGALDSMRKELKELDADLERATGAGTSYDTWKRLSEKELPSIREEAVNLEHTREKLLRKIEEYDRDVNEKQEVARDAETLAKPVANITKYSAEEANIKTQIAELAAKEQDAGLSRTLEDLQEEIETIGTKSRSLRVNLTKIQADERRARSQVSTFEVELGKLKNQLTTANNELEKRTRILSQIDELKKSTQDQRDGIIKLDAELQGLSPQFAEQEAKRDDLKQRGEAKERQLQREATSLADSVRNLQRADQDIRAYIEEGGPSKLEKCQRDIQNLEQEIVLLEAELKQITVEINKIREELGNQDQNKRVINDNLKYRKTHRELDAVKIEIEQLSAQNAEEDQEHHRRQAEKYQRQHNLFSTEETSKMGIMKAKDDQLGQLIDDWETDYKDAALKYKKSHIEVEVSSVSFTVIDIFLTVSLDFQSCGGRSWTICQCVRQVRQVSPCLDLDTDDE